METYLTAPDLLRRYFFSVKGDPRDIESGVGLFHAHHLDQFAESGHYRGRRFRQRSGQQGRHFF